MNIANVLPTKAKVSLLMSPPSIRAAAAALSSSSMAAVGSTAGKLLAAANSFFSRWACSVERNCSISFSFWNTSVSFVIQPA